MYPRVLIHLRKFRKNVEVIKKNLDEKGIGIYGVSKVFCSDTKIAEIFAQVGLDAVADSRIENLKKMEKYKIEKVLLRLPMQSEIEEVIHYADVSLNSEISTLELLGKEALKQGKIHCIILMVDLGDLREGFYEEGKLVEAARKTLSLKGLNLIGIGTNLTCFGGIIPKVEHMNRLIELKELIEFELDIKLDIISGGNSSSYYLAEKNELPGGINNLRLGEIFACGVETAFGKRVPGTYDDVFVLEAEIVELKKKPSLPVGEVGMDAFGMKPSYQDKGEMLRAICAVGKQDVDVEGLIPMNEKIEIIGRSSDHLILDLTHSGITYKVGDIIQFKLKYSGILSVMTSSYVRKEYIKQSLYPIKRREYSYGKY